MRTTDLASLRKQFSRVLDVRDVQVKPFYVSFPVLLRRSLVNLSRQPELLLHRITQSVSYALILACFYAPVGHDQRAIQNRIGNLYELTAACFLGLLNVIAIFPTERNVFYREYPDGHYSSMAFIACFFVIAIPLNIIAALLIAVLMTCAIGLVPTIAATLQFTYCVFIFMFSGECLGVIFCAAFHQIGFSVNVVSAVLSFFGVMAGSMALTMPKFIRDISYVSTLTWGSYIIANVALEGQEFSCDLPEGCSLTTGNEVLELYKFKASSKQMNFYYYILAVLTVIYLACALIAVRLHAYRISH